MKIVNANAENGIKTYQAIVAAPGFSLGIHCSTDEIFEIEFLPAQKERFTDNLLAQETTRQLRAWLKNPHFVFALPLAPTGTSFQKRVWAQISAIPCGETRHYGDLATTLHSAPRAVGGACGANPYPLIIPCHRVIAKDGGLGGFNRERGGLLLDIKRWLLAHERMR